MKKSIATIFIVAFILALFFSSFFYNKVDGYVNVRPYPTEIKETSSVTFVFRPTVTPLPIYNTPWQPRPYPTEIEETSVRTPMATITPFPINNTPWQPKPIPTETKETPGVCPPDYYCIAYDNK